MKLIYFLLLVTIVTELSAQGPVIEGMYLPVRGTRIEQVYDTTAVALDIPSKGENQVWDYSNKFVNILDTFELATDYPESTPYFSHYPEATHASFLRAPFGFGDSLWLYFIVDTAGINNIGMYGKTGFGPDTNIYVNPSELMMPSSVWYGREVVDSSVMTTFINYLGTDAKYVMTSYKTLTGEGYGSLTTPIGSFDDVILGTERIHRIDSVFPDINGDGVYDNGFQLSDSWSVRYNFLRNNTFGSTHLMQLKADEQETVIDYGWYTLPVDFGSIRGNVFENETNTPVQGGEALLYREHSNFSKDDILARAPIDANGYYQFDSIPYGEYRIAARANKAMYPTAYTTYIGDTVNWLNTVPIITSGDTSNNNDITMRYYNDHSGSGFFYGYIDLDMSVGQRSGNPVPGIDIIVEEDPEGVPVLQLTTDDNGYFDISSLEPGNYKLWVDVPGLDMAGTYSFEITNDEMIPDLNFTIGIDSIYPEYQVGIYESYSDFNRQIEVYPNPIEEEAFFAMNFDYDSKASIEVYSLNGGLVYRDEFNVYANHQKQMRLDFERMKLSTGTYLIKIQTEKEILRTNIVKY